MDMEYSTDNNMSNGEGQQNKADSTEVRLLIENSNVGAIIGKGGCNSKRIREENNVFLSIMKSDFRNVHAGTPCSRSEPTLLPARLEERSVAKAFRTSRPPAMRLSLRHNTPA